MPLLDKPLLAMPALSLVELGPQVSVAAPSASGVRLQPSGDQAAAVAYYLDKGEQVRASCEAGKREDVGPGGAHLQ